MSAQCHAAAVELNEVKAGKRKWVGRAGNACNAIRDLGDVDENRVGKFLGSIGIRMADFVEVGDEGERKRRVQENEAFEDGDPRIEWEIGCAYLSVFLSLLPLNMKLTHQSFPLARSPRTRHHARCSASFNG